MADYQFVDLLAEWMEENPTKRPEKAAAAAETAGIDDAHNPVELKRMIIER